ncbi:MAG: hypothetical protein KI786_13635 [Mameliella sp.]|nr:hypothetical protein [Phaeodactylibacter sp.]NRA49751.1 hypothetical protein [Phaeodactylibacter sp.]
MDNKYLAKVNQSLSEPVPEHTNMDDSLRAILKVVRPLSEDLREEQFYLNKPWLEFRDDENFHDAILHFFNDEGEYLQSVNGDVEVGEWRYMSSSNKLMVNIGDYTELYDLAFLDPEFFILSKHGDNRKLGRPEYLVLLNERVGRRLVWREALEKLFNKYRNNNSYLITITLIVLALIALVVLLSY